VLKRKNKKFLRPYLPGVMAKSTAVFVIFSQRLSANKPHPKRARVSVRGVCVCVCVCVCVALRYTVFPFFLPTFLFLF